MNDQDDESKKVLSRQKETDPFQNQNTGDQTSNNKEYHFEGSISWSIRQIQNYLKQNRAYYDEESPTDRAARRTANATWAIVFLTFVTIGVGIYQYRAMREADRTTRESFTAVQRAFVIVTGLNIKKRDCAKRVR